MHFFQVTLSTQPTGGGAAGLVPPAVLRDLDFDVVIVKDGGEEGILKLEGSAAVLKMLAKDEACKKLTKKQMASLRKSYPPPKLRQQYRPQVEPTEAGEVETTDSPFAVDERGKPIIDTIQTIRSGFHLIDVPILPPENGG